MTCPAFCQWRNSRICLIGKNVRAIFADILNSPIISVYKPIISVYNMTAMATSRKSVILDIARGFVSNSFRTFLSSVSWWHGPWAATGIWLWRK
jgi:hypothetical protein